MSKSNNNIANLQHLAYFWDVSSSLVVVVSLKNVVCMYLKPYCVLDYIVATLSI
jgi:hypothetical protein